MNHKRRRPKKRRAGCLFCKPWKGNGMKHKVRATVVRATVDGVAALERDAEAIREDGRKLGFFERDMAALAGDVE